MVFNSKAYKILCWSIPITILILFFGKNGTFDLQLHDTYIVIARLSLIIFFLLILAFLATFYWLLRGYKMIVVLSLLHSIITAVLIIGISLLLVIRSNYGLNEMEVIHQLDSVTSIFLLILVLVQSVFLINVLIGLFRGKAVTIH